MLYREYFIESTEEQAGLNCLKNALATCMAKAKKRFQFPAPLSHTVHVYGSNGMHYVTVLFGANI